VLQTVLMIGTTTVTTTAMSTCLSRLLAHLFVAGLLSVAENVNSTIGPVASIRPRWMTSCSDMDGTNMDSVVAYAAQPHSYQPRRVVPNRLQSGVSI
jgi:hypothetical protein